MAKLFVKERFGLAPSSVLNDKTLTFKAKGIYTYIQSKPDGWEFSAERIARQGLDKITSIRSGLKELENAGLLIRKKTQNDRGHWEMEYILFLEKTLENPTSENPTSENPTSENLPNNSKKDSSKKEYKEDIDSIRNINISSESLSPKKNEKYIQYAEFIGKIITSSKNIKITRQKINSWANSIRLLHTADGVSLDRIEDALLWYEKNHGGDYVPVIESGKSFRDKFIKLENAIERGKRPRRNTAHHSTSYTPREKIKYRKPDKIV